MKQQNFNQQYFEYAGKLAPPGTVKATVKEVLQIYKDRQTKPLKDINVLDVGSGFGLYSMELFKYVNKIVGVEPVKESYDYAVNHIGNRKNVAFYNEFIQDFKTNEKFDLALSLTTIEHMPEAEKDMQKVMSLLKPGGLLYLTAPNKLWPIESHYALPFLSYLPLPLANAYLHISRRGTSYEDASYSKTYFSLKRMLDKLPATYNFFLPSPNAGYLGCGSSKGQILKQVGIPLIKRFPILWTISKGFIVIVTKIE